MNNPTNTDAADRIIQFLTEPPAPAAEVVTLERAVAETIVRHLEDTGALVEPARLLNAALVEPKAELWAIHSVGPGEVFPALSREQAEQEAQELRDVIKVGMGIDVEINVIPSPFEPAEHFEILAEETAQHRDDALAALKALSEAVTPDVIDWLKCGLPTNGRLIDGTHPALEKLKAAMLATPPAQQKEAAA